MSNKPKSSGLFSPNVRQVISNISQRIFYPEPKAYDHLKDERPDSEIATSLSLQVSMFFNIVFFPFWITSHALMLNIKYLYLDNTYQVILIGVLVIFSLIELIRLYLGYVGNLQEKAAELFGFLLLSVLPQFPFLLFLLLNDNAIVMPLERAVDIILTILMIVEIVSAFMTGRSMSRQQATQFHLRQFIDLEQIQEHEFIDPNAPQIIKRPTYRA